MKKTIFVSAILSLIILAACQTKVTNKALKHGDRFKEAIEDFENNRQRLSSKMVTGIESTQKKLAEGEAKLPALAKDWEKEWNDIQDRYKKMKDDFKDVGERSAAYFDHLDQLSGSINNVSLRESELAKNRQLREKWESSYQKAGVSIEKITQVLNDGKDFHMVLVASSIREKIEDKITDLNDISEQAKVLLKDLEAFTQAGRELVQG